MINNLLSQRQQKTPFSLKGIKQQHFGDEKVVS